MAQLYRESNPSKAVLLHAHEDGEPWILKFGIKRSVNDEYQVWKAVQSTGINEQSAVHLVPLTLVRFETSTISIGDTISGNFVVHSRRCGVLMKHYQGTAQCRIPLKAHVLLRFGDYLRTAIPALH